MFRTTRILESYRRRSEDRADVVAVPSGVVIVLADGAGGTSGGAEAADTVMMWVKAFAAGAGDIHKPAQWADLLGRIDSQIAMQGGQTTAVIAAVSPGGICGASVGDSAAWLIQPDGHVDLTAGQVRKPLLGSDAARPMPFEHAEFRGTLLVASDGLIKYAPPQRICEAARIGDLNAAGRRLIDLVRLRSGALQDDVSLVLCRP